MFEREGNDLLLEGLRHLIKYWFHCDLSILQGLKGTWPNYWCNHTPFVLKFKFMHLNQLILFFLIFLLLVTGKQNVGCAREYNIIEKPERKFNFWIFRLYLCHFHIYPTLLSFVSIFASLSILHIKMTSDMKTYIHMNLRTRSRQISVCYGSAKL